MNSQNPMFSNTNTVPTSEVHTVPAGSIKDGTKFIGTRIG